WHTSAYPVELPLPSLSQRDTPSRHNRQGISMDAIELLKQDHRRIEQLFSAFLDTEAENSPHDLFQEIETELGAHIEAESRVFYGALREHASGKVEAGLKQHARIKKILADLLDTDLNEEAFETLFSELIEDVRHHVEEEEGPGGVLETARTNLNQETLA